jgi:ankyrin repeat protein
MDSSLPNRAPSTLQDLPRADNTSDPNEISHPQSETQDDDLKDQLFEASLEGDEETVRSLLGRGVDPSSTRNGQGANCLHAAAQNGHETIASLLVAHGADVRSQAPQGWTVLHSAAMGDSKAIVRLLVDHGAAVSAVLINNDTALHIAAREGHADAVEALVEKGADILSRGNMGLTSLHIAAGAGHELTAKRLLDRCVQVPMQSGATPAEGGNDSGGIAKLRADLLSSRTKDGVTAVHMAAGKGHVAATKLLLTYGADPLVTDNEGNDSIRWALRSRHLPVIEAILQARGADLSTSSNPGSVPVPIWPPILRLLAFAGDESSVSLLLKNGVKDSADEEKGWTALLIAAAAGHEAIVRFLLEYGGDISCAARDGHTVLYGAAEGGHEGVVKILLEHGAKSTRLVSQDTGDGPDARTPLYAAAKAGHERVVEILLERGSIDEEQAAVALFAAVEEGQERVVRSLLDWGAVTSVKTGYGTNGLHLAATRGDDRILELLLDSGLRSAANRDGMTPLHFAASRGHEACARALLQREPQSIDETADGKTALHLAAEKGHEGVVRLLLAKGIDHSALDRDGWSAADTARREGHEDLAKLLFGYRAHVPEAVMLTEDLAARLQARALRSEHQHQPLPDASNYVRLLVLDAAGPDEEIISGTLKIVCLDDSPQYVALSYAWGEPKFDYRIVCDGCEMLVTGGLYGAMRRLRRMTQRIFWIDQICINQVDEGEVTQQVGIMSRIYSQARSVYIWLGEHDETTDEGLSMARFVVDSSAKTDGQQSNLGIPEFWLHQKPGLSREKTWASWARLYGKLWFSRLWVVQEYVCARDHRIFCGDFEIPKKLFLSALLTKKGLKISVTPIDPILSGAGALGSVSNLESMEALRENRQSYAYTLIISLTARFGCSNPRDKIFALLGLLPDDPGRPKSEYSLPMRDVYQRFAKYFIGAGLGDIILGFSGLDHADPSLKLPTWCPDWSLGNGKRVLQMKGYDAAGSLTTRVTLNQENPELVTVDGCLVDIIAGLGPVLNGNGRFLEMWRDYFAWFTSSKHLIEHATESRYSSDPDPLQLWCRLITTLSNETPDDRTTQSYLEFHKEVTEEARELEGWNVEEYYAPYDNSSAQEISCDLSRGDPNDECQANRSDNDKRHKTGQYEDKDAQEAGKPSEKEMQKPRPIFRVPNMACLVQLGGWFDRRVCLTQAGYLGMVGKHAQIGNHVAVFFGIRSVKLLHKQGDVFQNIGGVSLLDLENEDISGMVRSGPTDIVIC